MLQKKLNLNLTLSNNFKPSFEYRTLTQGLFSRNAHQRPNHLSFDNHSTNKKTQLPNNYPTHANLSLSHYNNHKSYSLNKTYTHNFLGGNSNTIHTNINYNSYKKPPKKKNITINNVKNLFTNVPAFIPIATTTNSINHKKNKQQTQIIKPYHINGSNIFIPNNNTQTKTIINPYGIGKNHNVGNNIHAYNQHNSSNNNSNSIHKKQNDVNQKFKTFSLSASASTKGMFCKDNGNVHHGLWVSTDSTLQSTDDSRNIIPKLQKEILYLRNKNDTQKKMYEGTIKKLSQELKETKDKVFTLVQSCNKLKQENEMLKDKEKKLMKMFYLLNQKGIDINDIIALVQEENEDINNNNCSKVVDNSTRSAMSLTEVKFIDKTKCNQKENPKTKVPKLDFHLVPEYESSEEEEEVFNDYAIEKGKKDKHAHPHHGNHIKHNSSF